VFTRSTWTAVGVLVTLVAVQTGRTFPGPVDPAVATGVVTGLAWVVVGLVLLAHMRGGRPGPRRTRRPADGAPAEAALRRKLEYLANLSHEIRTPITSILGYTDVLCTEDVTPEEQLAHLETIRRNGDHLLAVVRDVLDLSRIDAGDVEPVRVETDVPSLVLDVVDMMRGEATAKGLALEARARGRVPATIETDPTRLRQILINLVANAVKFTDAGTVAIVVGTDASGRLVVDVVDQGPGLSETEQATIFEPWMQGEAATLAPGGSGLGLAVARGLARVLGGELSVASRSDAGSVFTVSMPLGREAAELLDPEVAFARLPAPTRHVAPGPRLQGRVLLVEDGADTRRLLAHFLRHAGCDVGTAVDGRDGIEALTAAAAAGRPFDLVFMDMEMPILDGWETTRRVRAQGLTVPIVALTAYGGADRLAACLAAGCTEVLQKPATRTELLEAVHRHLAVAPSPADGDASEWAGTLGELPQVHTLMRMFVTILEQRMAEMEDALAADEPERLGRLAHRLRGAAGSYGFVAISDAAGVLEAAAQQGRDVRACLDRLAAMCRQAGAAYRSGGAGGSA
jgi:signal transduction histidine kinase/CheY-like chemotaxis protein/HPt (histidine-containing phosphotransfer) domain-containing protein